MPKVTSMGDLAKLISSQQGAALVATNQQVKRNLEEAANLLKSLLQQKLQDYYDSYEPLVYERTYALLNSLRVDAVQQKGALLSIKVYFDDSATHPSLFGGEAGFTPTLINEGWSWSNGMNIYHLSHYEGFHFVERALEAFDEQNRWGFKVTKTIK